MSKFEVTADNNSIQIFRLPKKMPSRFCFDGGHKVEFQLVDWFSPIICVLCTGVPIILKEVELKKCRERIQAFIKDKTYFDPDFVFLAITDYGDAFLIGDSTKPITWRK